MKTTKRFVLDTNTLISAFLLSPQSVAAQCYYRALGTGVLLFSDATLNEFADVFVRPKFDRYVPLAKRLTIIDDLKVLAKTIPVEITIQACRDAKDDKFLELAVEAVATCIVTGDKDLLELNPFRHIDILTPADFLSSSKY